MCVKAIVADPKIVYSHDASLLSGRFLARPAFSLLRQRSSNSLQAEAEDNDKVLNWKILSLKPLSLDSFSVAYHHYLRNFKDFKKIQRFQKTLKI